MDYKYIEQLLERYFEAETSLKEEQILKAFFEQSEEELPAELRTYKGLFAALAKDETLGSDFDERILQLTEDQTGQKAASEEVRSTKARIISMSERLKPLLRAAAVVAIVLTLAGAINQSFVDNGIWTGEEQVADYKAALRQMAETENADSMLLYSEGTVFHADSLASDSLYGGPTGFVDIVN